MPAQPPAVGIAHMIDPALNSRVELRKADFSTAVGNKAFTEMAGCVSDLVHLNATVGEINDKTQPRNTAAHWHHLCGRLVDDQS